MKMSHITTIQLLHSKIYNNADVISFQELNNYNNSELLEIRNNAVKEYNQKIKNFI